MTRKVTLLLLAFIGIHIASFAQLCGFGARQSQAIATNPAIAAAVADFEAKWQNYVNSQASGPQLAGLKVSIPPADTVYEIPVIVHVMFTSANAGPSNGQIQAYLDYINNAFAANGANGFPDVTSGGTRVPLKFVLAKRDTACPSANFSGIIRVNAGAASPAYFNAGVNYITGGGMPENTMKSLSRWNPTLYFNIWIVTKIDNNDGSSPNPTYAFAADPITTSPGMDGLVLLSSLVTGLPTPPASIPALPYFLGVHEMGHAFGLREIYDPSPGTSGCPPNTNCASTGDRICDTDPIQAAGGSGCPLISATNSCTGGAYGTTPRNFMDNTTLCTDLRFTPGQRNRMMYTLKSVLSRSHYITSLGATTPTTATNVKNNTCNSGTGFIRHPSQPATPSFDIGVINTVIADPFTIPTAARDTFMHVTSNGGFLADGGVTTNAVWRDMTCRHRATLRVGRSYRLTVVATNNTRVRAWIDYNNDGAFTSNERIMDAGSFGGPTKTNDFTIPTTAVKCTPLRMRVVGDFLTSGNPQECTAELGQAEDYSVYLKSPGADVTASVSINNPPIGGNPSCNGTELTFYQTVTSATNPLIITGRKWYVNGVLVPGATTDTLRSSTIFPNNTFNIPVISRIFFNTPCGIDSATSNTVFVTRQATVTPSATIDLVGGTVPGCVDDTLTFRVVNTTNPGSPVTFVWQRSIDNGANWTNVVSGTHGVFNADSTVMKTIPSSTVWPGSTQTKIRVVMTARSACAPSNPYTFTPTSPAQWEQLAPYTQTAPTVSIALTTGSNPGCAGETLTFTATATSAGPTPTYTWYINGVAQTGVTTNTFSKAFNNNDQVSASISTTSPCATTPNATSNVIIVTHRQITADIAIDLTTTPPICDSYKLDFIAYPINGGINPPPTIQWQVNGVDVGTPQSGTTSSFVVRDADTVTAILIATDPCIANPRDTSAKLGIDAQPSQHPNVTLKVTQGTNPGCLDSLLELSAIVTEAGTNPAFFWTVNGFPAGTNTTFSSNTLLDGDIIRVRVNTTDGQCYLPGDTVYSKPDTMVRSITLDPPVIHLLGNMIKTDRQGSFVWFGPGGEVKGQTGEQYYPTQTGSHYAITNNRGCWSRPSNILNITLLDINTVNLEQDLKIYPNPSTGILTIDWYGKNVNVDIAIYNNASQKVMTESVRNASAKTLNLEKLAAGNYYIVITDENKKSGTVKIALSK